MKNIPFSPTLKEVVSVAMEEAVRLHTNFIGPRHLVLALAKKKPAVFTAFLEISGATLPEIVKDVELEIPREEPAAQALAVRPRFSLFKLRAARPARLYLNRPAEKVIRDCVAVAARARSESVEPEHLLQSILNNTDAVHKR